MPLAPPQAEITQFLTAHCLTMTGTGLPRRELQDAHRESRASRLPESIESLSPEPPQKTERELRESRKESSADVCNSSPSTETGLQALSQVCCAELSQTSKIHSVRFNSACSVKWCHVSTGVFCASCDRHELTAFCCSKPQSQ